MYSFKTLMVVISSIMLVSAQSSTTSTSTYSDTTSSSGSSSSSVSISSGSGTTSTAPAPSSSIIDGLTPCMTNCATAAAAAANCSTYFDLKCVCNSNTYKSQMSSCLSSNCTSAEQAAATQQANQECAFVTAAGVQSTINNPASTGAAIEKKYVLGGSVTWGAVVAMAGAAVGAGLTL